MPRTPQLFVGLISGTSMDGVDAALLDTTEHQPRVLATHCEPWPEALRNDLMDLAVPGRDSIELLGKSDISVARVFAKSANTLLRKAGISSRDVSAIGSHGQTVRHRPNQNPAFTLQIGDPNTLAEETGITVVADFRRRDMAAGGQGAPLVPAFHADIFRSPAETRVVLNLGGIANITLLPANTDQPISGFDTGPANTLLDAWTRRHLGIAPDAEGQWAASGKVDSDLLQSLLADAYFQQRPPKTTGPEYFSLEWLQGLLGFTPRAPQNIQSTLVALTVKSVANSIRSTLADCRRVLVCGGGVHNSFLMAELRKSLPELRIESTAIFGLDPDFVEAAAFAWLAYRHVAGRPGNLPAVTGATRPVILGGIYPANGELKTI